MRARHRQSNARSFDGQVAPPIHFEVWIDGKSVIVQCNCAPVRHFRLFENGSLVKTILASHVHDVLPDPNSSTQILLTLDFTASSITLSKKKLMEMGSSLTLKVDSTSVNERDRMWQFFKAMVDDDYELACQQYHWPHVPTLKEGASKKKGKHLGAHSVWLVLHPGRLLMYRKSGDDTPVKVMLLTEVNVDPQGDAGIVIHLRSRSYELSFNTAQEAEEWRIAIRCEVDLTTQLRPQNIRKPTPKQRTPSVSTKFDLSSALEASSNTPSDPNACGLAGCLNMKEPSIDFCSKHANLQAKKLEREEALHKEREQKLREEEEQLRLKLLEEATNNPIFWKQAVETESGERFYFNQAAKLSQYARPLCLLQQDKLEAVQWTELKDVEGRRAWHNIKTGVTTKVRPECLGRDPAMNYWKEAISETGETYWYNKHLMISTYENPFLEELKRQERELLEAPACPPMKEPKGAQLEEKQAMIDSLTAQLEEERSTVDNLTVQVVMGQLKIEELTKACERRESDEPCPPPPFDESQEIISDLTKQVSASTLSMQSLMKQVAEAQATIEQLTSQVSDKTLTVQRLTTQNLEAHATIKKLEAQVSEQQQSLQHHAKGSESLAQQISESQALVAKLTAQLAETQRREPTWQADAARSHGKSSSVSFPTATAEQAALTLRLDRLEEQNRQLMLMLKTQQRAASPPAREPPARPAPRVVSKVA